MWLTHSTKRSYKRVSPWFELALAGSYFLQQPLPYYDQLNFELPSNAGTGTAQQKILLERHKTRLYSNSQFWH